MQARIRTWGAVAAVFLWVAPAAAATRDDREGAEALVARYTEAWNRHDRGAFSIVYADDAALAEVLARWAHEPGRVAEEGALRLRTRVVGYRRLSATASTVEVEWSLEGQRGRLIHTVSRGRSSAEITATAEPVSASVARAQ